MDAYPYLTVKTLKYDYALDAIEITKNSISDLSLFYLESKIKIIFVRLRTNILNDEIQLYIKIEIRIKTSDKCLLPRSCHS